MNTLAKTAAIASLFAASLIAAMPAQAMLILNGNFAYAGFSASSSGASSNGLQRFSNVLAASRSQSRLFGRSSSASRPFTMLQSTPTAFASRGFRGFNLRRFSPPSAQTFANMNFGRRFGIPTIARVTTPQAPEGPAVVAPTVAPTVASTITPTVIVSQPVAEEPPTTEVPEPGTLGLLLLGAGALVVSRRRPVARR